MKQVISTEKKPIKLWLDDIEPVAAGGDQGLIIFSIFSLLLAFNIGTMNRPSHCSFDSHTFPCRPKAKPVRRLL